MSHESDAQEPTIRSSEIVVSVASAAAFETELTTEPTPNTTLTGQPHVLPPPLVRKPEPPSSNPDLVYVYEVAAEEFAPMADGPPVVSSAEELEPMLTVDMSAIEIASDEALPFEVPAEVGVDVSAEPAPALGESTGRTANEVAAQLKKKITSPPLIEDQRSLFENTKRSEKAPEA